MRLVLVRHAEVTVDRSRPIADWHLSPPTGRAAADALAGEPFWEGVPLLYASAEPKAAATAQRIAARLGLPICIEPDLREVEGRVWVESGYRDLVGRYLEGELIDGWEARAEALERVRGCLERIAARSAPSTAAVSHGLVLTLYASDVLGLDAAAPYDLWSRLAFPDVLVFDTETRRLERGPALPLTAER